MITATSNPPTSDVRPTDDHASPRRRPPRQSTWVGKVLILVLFAAVTAGVLALAGVFDSSSSDINLDPVGNPGTTASTAAPRAVDSKVVSKYLASLNTWNDCMEKHLGDGTTDKCGAMPEQVDDPTLNAYLNDVLNWNKCAAPLLKRGALAQAEAACGPNPAVPTTD